MSELMIPTPTQTGWLGFAALLVYVLGKPALESWRAIRSKQDEHTQSLELKAVSAKEQEDRELINLLKNDVADLRARLAALEGKYEAQTQRVIALERENAVLRYIVAGEKPAEVPAP